MTISSYGSTFDGFETLDAPLARAREVSASLRGTAIEVPASVFVSSAETALSLATMPVALVLSAYANASAVVASEAFFASLPDEQRARALAQRDELEPTVIRKLQDQLRSKVPPLLNAVSAQEPLASTIQALLRAVVVQAWTGFECLAVDLWVTALNADFTLGQSALAAEAPAEMPEGLSRRSVSIEMLGRHRFDLSGKMGTVLRDKFHFGSCDGMETAYLAAFPGSKARRLFREPALADLEAARHLIVHRGGIVDAEFRRKSQGAPEIAGQLLLLNGSRVGALLTAGVAAGVNLLEFGRTLACAKPSAQ